MFHVNANFLLVVTLFGFFELVANQGLNLISSVVTPFGDWNNWQDCAVNTFVTSLDVRAVSRPRKLNPKFTDDLGLISMALECSQHENGSKKFAKLIYTEVGGVFNTVKNGTLVIGSDGDIRIEEDVVYTYPFVTSCEEVAIGAQFMIQSEQVAIDNTAVTNLRIFCSELKDSTPDYIEAYGTYSGDWDSVLHCNKRQAICGIQTLAQSIYDDSFDNTGINSIRLRCCKVPNPALTCTPYDTWELIQECNNFDSATASKCSYVRQVGLVRANTESSEYDFNENIGYSLYEDIFWAIDGLGLTFRKLGVSEETGYDWTKSNSEMFELSTSEVVEYEVPGTFLTKIYQVVGKCSYLNVKTPTFKIISEG